ncbi:MAG TPA: hypothetical protein VK141_06460 [Nitrosomonas sp.]|nr:hypothetical protein [Nitrosomonas sp.]
MTKYYFGFTAFVLLAGCIFRSVTNLDLVGTYETMLPDGGREILELKSDGVCGQKIALKAGGIFMAQGSWKYDNEYITLKKIHLSVDVEGNINPRISQISVGMIVLPVGRDLAGKVIIGSIEGTYYERMRK